MGDVVDGGAVQVMKDLALRSRPHGGRLQTASCCAGRGDRGGERWGKGARSGCQVGTRKANVSESLLTCRYRINVTSKPGCLFGPGMSLAGARRVGQVVSGMEATRAWSAAAAWNVGRRAPIPSDPVGWARGRASSSRNCEVLSTVAGCAGGLARSSDEAPVMGVERRGQTIVTGSLGQPRGWEEPW